MPIPTARYVSSPCVRDSAMTPASFAPPDVEIVGPLQGHRAPGLLVQDVARPARDRDRNDRQRLGLLGPPHDRQVETLARRRRPGSPVAAVGARLRFGDEHRRAQPLFLLEVDLDEVARERVRRRDGVKADAVLEDAPAVRIDPSAGERRSRPHERRPLLFELEEPRAHLLDHGGRGLSEEVGVLELRAQRARSPRPRRRASSRSADPRRRRRRAGSDEAEREPGDHVLERPDRAFSKRRPDSRARWIRTRRQLLHDRDERAVRRGRIDREVDRLRRRSAALRPEVADAGHDRPQGLDRGFRGGVLAMARRPAGTPRRSACPPARSASPRSLRSGTA